MQCGRRGGVRGPAQSEDPPAVAEADEEDAPAPAVAGVAVFAGVDGLPTPDPMAHETVAVHLTEACVIVSLLGAGLALDRRVGWRRWSSTWRLLAISMPAACATNTDARERYNV